MPTNDEIDERYWEEEGKKNLQRLEEEKEKHRMMGHVMCIECGTWGREGAMHYPGHDPENGPAHVIRIK